MHLTDLQSADQWTDLEKRLNAESGMNSCVFDADGVRVTKFMAWANPLCPKIKSNPESAKAICSVAHQNLSGQARDSGKIAIGECDAGFVKFCVPIVRNGEYLGVAGCCGKRMDDADVETFFISKATGMDEAEAEELAKQCPPVPRTEVERLAGLLDTWLADIG